MTGSEALAYVKKILQRTDKDSEVYEAMTDVVADMSIRMKSDEYSQESSTLSGISSVGDYKLTLPTDFGHLIGDVMIKDATADQEYMPLKKITKESYDQMYSDHLLSTASNRHTGVPRHYCVFGSEIYVGPCVDSTNYEFYINYTSDNTTAVTSGTDPVPFSSNKYRKCFRYGVLAQVYELLENYEASQFWQAKYEIDLSKIVDDDWDRTMSSESIQYSGV